MLGMGSFGSALASRLAENGCRVIGVDQKKDRMELVKNQIYEAVIGDSTDREVLEAVAKVIPEFNAEKARIVWIKNTLQLEEMLISEAMASEAEALENVRISAAPVPMEFGPGGNLVNW